MCSVLVVQAACCVIPLRSAADLGTNNSAPSEWKQISSSLLQIVLEIELHTTCLSTELTLGKHSRTRNLAYSIVNIVLRSSL